MSDAYQIIDDQYVKPRARWVISCDHASNRVPWDVAGGDLGLPPEDMARHIAYDIGALGCAQALAEALAAPLVASRFSRLVIDPNRGEDDPTLIMQVYDGSIIPGNRGVDEAETTRRLDNYHRPYHQALRDTLAAHPDALLVSVHSFTPQLRGRAPRPWHVGVLYAEDTRLSEPLIARLEAEPDLCVGCNQPYIGALAGDALDQHGLQTGRPHVLIEIRNDLIADAAGQAAWGRRLAPLLDAAARDANL